MVVMPFKIRSRADPQRRGWNNQELAEFYRIKGLLDRAGLVVDVDHGLLCVAGDNLAPGGNATVRCGKSNPNNFDIWHAGAVLAQLLQSLLIENHYLGG